MTKLPLVSVALARQGLLVSGWKGSITTSSVVICEEVLAPFVVSQSLNPTTIAQAAVGAAVHSVEICCHFCRGVMGWWWTLFLKLLGRWRTKACRSILVLGALRSLLQLLTPGHVGQQQTKECHSQYLLAGLNATAWKYVQYSLRALQTGPSFCSSFSVSPLDSAMLFLIQLDFSSSSAQA